MSETNPGGWPDPNKPGYPVNPEQEGFHWIAQRAPWGPLVVQWEDGTYWLPGGEDVSAETAADRDRWSYLGPCLPPEQAAAERDAARQLAFKDAALLLDHLRVVASQDCVRLRIQTDRASKVDAIRMAGAEGALAGAVKILRGTGFVTVDAWLAEARPQMVEVPAAPEPD